MQAAIAVDDRRRPAVGDGLDSEKPAEDAPTQAADHLGVVAGDLEVEAVAHLDDHGAAVPDGDPRAAPRAAQVGGDALEVGTAVGRGPTVGQAGGDLAAVLAADILGKRRRAPVRALAARRTSNMDSAS